MACKPDHTPQLKRINRMIGQLGGIKKMIEDEVYCPEILIQTKAVSSALRSLETTLLEGHLNGCVTDALESGKESEEKIDELLQIFRTRIK